MILVLFGSFSLVIFVTGLSQLFHVDFQFKNTGSWDVTDYSQIEVVLTFQKIFLLPFSGSRSELRRQLQSFKRWQTYNIQLNFISGIEE